jgi:glutamyl-tRNA synthetase
MIKTRFAPSPTGYLHVGGVRTALFAWLVARENNGKFALRIEDTDRNRHVEGADKHIIESLNWLGLDFDEGPIYQSQRVKDGVYEKWARKLIESGRAYADPYSKKELDEFRTQAQKEKKPFLFRNHRPENPPQWDGKTPLRFKSKDDEYKTTDLVMGEFKTGAEMIDDFILIKSDGYPTYNFAHIVDDLDMGITHVIRGQEFLSSMPNYLNLYEALGETPPNYATVPHILNEQGNKKLSKRDGAKDILDYKKQGFLPEAMINFLATLGWNDGTEQEVFSLAEIIEKFDLSRVHKNGAHFDERRLVWLNGAHIRKLPLDELCDEVEKYWPKSAQTADKNYKQKVLSLVQERMKFFSELPELTQFFFEDLPLDKSLIKNHKQLKKIESKQLAQWLEQTKESLLKINDSQWSAENIQKILNDLLENTQQKPVVYFSLVRIAITQAPASPSLAETIEVLGLQKTTSRIQNQINALAQ